MSTASPQPFPEAGLRPLSGRESLQRLKALACTRPQTDKPRCSGQVHVGLFFDGTGNNKQLDYDRLPPEKRKHSNVVRLYQSHQDAPTAGYFRHYIPGVGTPFPEIGDTNRPDGWWPGGSAMAEKGEHRIVWGLLQLINSVHYYVYNAPLIQEGQDKTIVNNLASSTNPGAMRRVALRTWQDKLQVALVGAKPVVEQINVSVFGFSRGAAESRAFCNWLFEVCKPEGGGWTLAGIPLRVSFLGIFDTVASVGLTNLFDDGVLRGHQSWADDNLEIHPAVERCVHYVAGHEVRACFPLDSVRVKTRYPANAKEVMYPGAHSDVGGGYAPGDLGVSPSHAEMYSIIPAASMYQEARLSGVPLKPLSALPRADQDALQPAPDTIRQFNAYLKDARAGTAPVEGLLRHHMALYFSYRFKHRHHFESRPLFTRASPEHQGYLRRTQATLIQRLRQLNQGDPMQADFDPARAARAHRDGLRQMAKASGIASLQQQTLAMERLCDVAEAIDVRKVTPGVEAFLEAHIHDSMAGFIKQLDEYKRNGIGFVKFRTVFKGDD